MMTNEEARNILHPSTTLEALAKYSDHGRLDKIKIVEEACIVACDALDKLIEKPDDDLISRSALKDAFCEHCDATFVHNIGIEECRRGLCSAMNNIDCAPAIEPSRPEDGA